MEKRLKGIVRLVLFTLILQTCVPFVFSLSAESYSRNSHLSFHTRHTTAITLFLLKEREEGETKTEEGEVERVELIDFSNLPSLISLSHEARTIPFSCTRHLDHRPPLITLLSVFKI